MQSVAQYSFPATLRLRKRCEFNQLSDSVNKYASRIFLLVWLDNDLDHARLGVTVSKKVGCAVTRNRIKRYLREIFRNNYSQLPSIDLNIIARSSIVAKDFAMVQRELLQAFKSIGISSCSRAPHSL